MKNGRTKRIAFALCAVLLFGTVGTVAYALTADHPNEKEKEETKPITANIVPDTEISKDETVYVLAGADGSVQKIIVSDWIKNSIGIDTIEDATGLSNIKTVKGEAGYTLGGDNTCVWDAQGNDIYYQGDIEKELPVELAVTYTLDGKKVSPDELAGQSGRVTIRFDYANKQYEYAEIDGKRVKMYVPFTMLTGLLLDNDTFTNVEVSNGKLVNDGERTAIVGIAFPGLQENLDIASEKLDIPDYVEITADVTDFKLGMTVTLATNELWGETDADDLGSVGDLSASLGELTDAMEQLMDGSSELYDGLCTLLEKSGDLVDGIGTLASGAKALKDGAGTLDEGVSKLQTGTVSLYSGLNTLASNSDSLNGGATQVFETLLSTANTQLTAKGLSVPAMTISNYADVLNGVIASLDETAVYEKVLAMVTAEVEKQRPYIEEQVTASIRSKAKEQVTVAVEAEAKAKVMETVRGQVTAQIISNVLNMSQAEYEAAVAAGSVDEERQTAIKNAIEEQMQSESVLQTIESNTATQMASETIQSTIAANVDAQMQSDNVKVLVAENTQSQVEKAISENMSSEKVQSQLAAASEGAQAVISLKASLDSYNSFYIGLQSYTAGVAQAMAGAGELKNGAERLKAGSGQLCGGISELYDGILTMQDKSPALIEGITQLRDGAMQLSDGLTEFNEKGIQKLVEAVDGDLDGLVERIRATENVSRNYKTFAGTNSDVDGQVKFIYRTQSVEAD